MMKELPVNRFDIDERQEIKTTEWVVSEKRIQITINNEEMISVSAFPCMVKALAVGYVVGGGFVRIDDIANVVVTENTINIVTQKPVESAGKHIHVHHSHETQKAHKPLKVSAPTILQAGLRLHSDSHVWKKTNAAHSAALFTKTGALLRLVEDSSRHSAFDKVVGQALLDGQDFSSSFIVLTGRITQEMVIRAKNVGILIIASRSTVIEPAVTMASSMGITLIGYVREGHVVVFSHPERVML